MTAVARKKGGGSFFAVELPMGFMTTPFLEDIKRECPEQLSPSIRDLSPGSVAGDFSALPQCDDGEKWESTTTATMGRRVTNILCVDDSTISRKITMRTLQSMGYKCFEAVDGIDCLEVFDKLRKDGISMDAILMDFEMPRMNGPTAVKELKLRNVTCPIIGITGNVLAEDQNIFLTSGAYQVLTKPLSMTLLEEAFGKFADESSAPIEAAFSVQFL
jgi:CheY-like chemotaxis protein